MEMVRWAILLVFATRACGNTLRAQNRFTVREEEPIGTNVAQLTGREFDLYQQQRLSIPIDAKLTLSQSPSSSLFAITRSGQLVTAMLLDRETICNSADYASRLENGDQCFVDVQIILLVPGAPPQKLLLPVLIQDVNNKAPVWQESQLVVTVPEEASYQQLRLPLAIDRDTAPNGVKKYRLVRKETGNTPFELLGNPREIILRVTQKLDREKQSSYNLTIEATDGAKTGQLEVLVVVTDVNDHAPSFSQAAYYFNVSETAPLGTKVGKVVAVDPDAGSNGNVVYSLTQVPYRCSGMFVIDANSGELSVAKSLDYEKATECQLTVQASDNGGTEQRSNFTTVYVAVLDENDNSPQIKIIRSDGEEKSLSLLENSTIGSIIGLVCASDADNNGQERVECESRSPLFALVQSTPCYELRLASLIDREAYSFSRLVVQINCSDRSSSASASASPSPSPSRETVKNLTVFIEDVNDNAPTFGQAVYHFSVAEGEPVTRPLGRVTAVDLDANGNSEISYAILRNVYVKVDETYDKINLQQAASNGYQKVPAFRITATGDLFATIRFDREVNNSYLLEILATDHGSPRLSSSAVVKITVTDKNDNPPEFKIGERYEFTVMEHSPVYTYIGNVMAMDVDEGVNGQVRYSLLPQDQAFFHVNESGHIFTVNDQLDRERNQGSFYSLVVMATDNADSPEQRLTATTTVTVIILDKNDNRPVFTVGRNTSITIDLRDKNIGDVIGKIEAVDIDDPLNGNGEVRYYDYRNSSSFFSVDELTGEIRLVRRPAPGNYGMLIRAQDRGTPPAYDLMSITVVVLGNQFDQLSETSRPSAFNSEIVQNLLLIGTLSAVAAVLSVILLITIYYLRKPRRNHGNNKQRRRRNGPNSTGKAKDKEKGGHKFAKSESEIRPLDPDAKGSGPLEPPKPKPKLKTSPGPPKSPRMNTSHNPVLAYSPVDCVSGQRSLPRSACAKHADPSSLRDALPGDKDENLDDLKPAKKFLESLASPHKRCASFETMNDEIIDGNTAAYQCFSERGEYSQRSWNDNPKNFRQTSTFRQCAAKNCQSPPIKDNSNIVSKFGRNVKKDDGRIDCHDAEMALNGDSECEEEPDTELLTHSLTIANVRVHRRPLETLETVAATKNDCCSGCQSQSSNTIRKKLRFAATETGVSDNACETTLPEVVANSCTGETEANEENAGSSVHPPTARIVNENDEARAGFRLC